MKDAASLDAASLHIFDIQGERMIRKNHQNEITVLHYCHRAEFMFPAASHRNHTGTCRPPGCRILFLISDWASVAHD